MNIPIELIVVSLSILSMALGGLIGIVVNSMNKLTSAINSIHEWMASKDTSDEFRANDCNKNHKNISNDLKLHTTQIHDHERRIIKLEK